MRLVLNGYTQEITTKVVLVGAALSGLFALAVLIFVLAGFNRTRVESCRQQVENRRAIRRLVEEFRNTPFYPFASPENYTSSTFQERERRFAAILHAFPALECRDGQPYEKEVG